MRRMLAKILERSNKVENIMDKTQGQIFDYLSEIVEYEMSSPFKLKDKKPKNKKNAKTM